MEEFLYESLKECWGISERISETQAIASTGICEKNNTGWILGDKMCAAISAGKKT